MQFSDNEIIALLFGTSLSEPGGMYVLLQLVPAVNQKSSATNSGAVRRLQKSVMPLVALTKPIPRNELLKGHGQVTIYRRQH